MESKVTHRNLAKHSHELLVGLGHRDSLTGLKNRRAFMEELTKAQSLLNRGKLTYKLLYLDLDNFKVINDEDPTHHETGDQTLIIVANTIQEILRTEDVVARIGGDEFGILMLENDPQEDGSIIKKLEKRFKDIFQEKASALIKKSPIVGHLGVSFGIIEPKRGDSVENIMQMADNLMYTSKNSKCVAHE